MIKLSGQINNSRLHGTTKIDLYSQDLNIFASPRTIRIAGQHFDFGIGSSEIARATPVLFAVSWRRQVQAAVWRQRATVNKDRETRELAWMLAEERGRREGPPSKSAFLRARIRTFSERESGMVRGARGAGDGGAGEGGWGGGSDLPGRETCHSLTPCHLHKQTYITGRQAASYVFPFMFPHARSHKPVSLVSRAAQSFTVAGSVPALTTVLLPAVESANPPRPLPDK